GLKDVVGRKVTEVIPGIKESNPELFEIYGRVAATGLPESFETYVEPLQIWLSLSVYSPATGYFVATFANITERKRVEEELRRSHENFRRSLDDSPLPIRIYRAGGTTVYANLLFLELFGCDSIEEFNATPPEKRFTPESYGQHQQRKEARKRNGFVPSDYEGSIVRRNGEIRHLRVFRKEVLWNGESHFQHLCYDITERKQIQEQLMLADRMATIGELASGVAHELNNPLTSVIGFSQLLMERELPDDIKEDLGLVYSEAQRAAHIVKNLLTFARKHAPVRQLCQIHNILEDVLKLRAHDQKANNIEVNRRFASDLPEITVDYFQMQQVFLNIILNAEYFMAEAHHKGTLTITTKRFDNTVRISVADDGPGIAQEDLGKVFNPFFTMKEVGKGTGLGLSLCHGIVSEHGGSIYVRSQLGEGATFVVELPVNGDLVKREVPHG
ncbi:MAG: domain S-box-containing protein, partial [Dehalococcoidia bacterium]|nr:domain S-box-containing protein [Dehalococcoidia bacterium]